MYEKAVQDIIPRPWYGKHWSYLKEDFLVVQDSEQDKVVDGMQMANASSCGEDRVKFVHPRLTSRLPTFEDLASSQPWLKPSTPSPLLSAPEAKAHHYRVRLGGRWPLGSCWALNLAVGYDRHGNPDKHPGKAASCALADTLNERQDLVILLLEML